MENKFKFSLDEIPEEIYGVKLQDANRQLIADGKESMLIEGMVMEGKELKNAKVRMVKNSKGENELAFSFQREQLIIPERIGDYTLTEFDKVKLTSGDTAGPVKINGTEVYLQVDKELNSVTVKSANEISMKDVLRLKEERGKLEVAGYKPSKSEVKDLIDGKELPTKIFSQDGKYFSARISLTEDDRGITFREITTLSPDKAKELMERLNVQREEPLASMVLGDVAQAGSKIVGEGQNLIQQEKTGAVIESGVNFIEQGREKEQFMEGKMEALQNAVKNNDLKAIEDWKQYENIKPSYEDVLKVCEANGLGSDDIHGVMLRMDDSEYGYASRYQAEVEIAGETKLERGGERVIFIDISEKNAINYPYEYEHGKYEVVESSQMLDVILYDKEKNLYGVVFNDDMLVGVGEREACTEKMNEFQTNFTKEMGIEEETKGVEDILEREFEKKIYDEREPLRGEEREYDRLVSNEPRDFDAERLEFNDLMNGVSKKVEIDLSEGGELKFLIGDKSNDYPFDPDNKEYEVIHNEKDYQVIIYDKEKELYGIYFIAGEQLTHVGGREACMKEVLVQQQEFDIYRAEKIEEEKGFVDPVDISNVDVTQLEWRKEQAELRGISLEEFNESLKKDSDKEQKVEDGYGKWTDIKQAEYKDDKKVEVEIPFVKNEEGKYELRSVDLEQFETLQKKEGFSYEMEYRDYVDAIGRDEFILTKEGNAFAQENGIHPTALGRFDYSQREIEIMDRLNGVGEKIEEVKKVDVQEVKGMDQKDLEFNEAYQNKDIKKINDLCQQGYKPSEDLVRNLESMPGITKEDRVAVRTVTGIEPKQELKGEKNQEGPTKSEGKQVKISPKEKEQGNDKKGGSLAKEAIDKLSRDM